MKTKNLAILIWGILGVVILGFIITLIVITNNNTHNDSNVNTSEIVTPTVVNEFGTFMVTSEGVVSPDTDTNDLPGLYIYLDPICPGCGVVDRELSPTFNELVNTNKVNLFITPLAFLDQASTDDYSSRVVSAAVTIAESEPEYFLPFLNKTFENQPEEGQDYISVTNDDLVKMAEEVGVSSEVAKTIKEEKYKAWAIENTNKVAQQTDVFPNGLGTPSLFINLRDENGKVINSEKLDFDTDLSLNEYIIEQIKIG